jgi:hypothetical protein
MVADYEGGRHQGPVALRGLSMDKVLRRPPRQMFETGQFERMFDASKTNDGPYRAEAAGPRFWFKPQAAMASTSRPR